MPDPHLEIRGRGGRSSRPLNKGVGGGRSSRPLNKGGGEGAHPDP